MGKIIKVSFRDYYCAFCSQLTLLLRQITQDLLENAVLCSDPLQFHKKLKWSQQESLEGNPILLQLLTLLLS